MRSWFRSCSASLFLLVPAAAWAQGSEKVNWGKIEFIKVDSFGTEYNDAIKDAAKKKQYVMIFFT